MYIYTIHILYIYTIYIHYIYTIYILYIYVYTHNIYILLIYTSICTLYIVYIYYIYYIYYIHIYYIHIYYIYTLYTYIRYIYTTYIYICIFFLHTLYIHYIYIRTIYIRSIYILYIYCIYILYIYTIYILYIYTHIYIYMFSRNPLKATGNRCFFTFSWGAQDQSIGRQDQQWKAPSSTCDVLTEDGFAAAKTAAACAKFWIWNEPAAMEKGDCDQWLFHLELMTLDQKVIRNHLITFDQRWLPPPNGFGIKSDSRNLSFFFKRLFSNNITQTAARQDVCSPLICEINWSRVSGCRLDVATSSRCDEFWGEVTNFEGWKVPHLMDYDQILRILLSLIILSMSHLSN